MHAVETVQGSLTRNSVTYKGERDRMRYNSNVGIGPAASGACDRQELPFRH